MRSKAYAIKVEVVEPRGRSFTFIAQKTMYGGKLIGKGDTVFVFTSENEGGRGLIARGVVSHAEAVPKKRGIARQTPRVSVTIRTTALAKRPSAVASSGALPIGMTVELAMSSISSFIGKQQQDRRHLG